MVARVPPLSSSREDRFLQKRERGLYRFVRRVPEDVQDSFGASMIRTTLKTADLHIARARRDALEEAQDKHWASLRENPEQNARKLYDHAAARAVALQLVPMPAGKVAVLGVEALLDRLDRLPDNKPMPLDEEAVLGLVEAPKVKLADAFEVYCNVIKGAELATKSRNQVRTWRKVKLRAIANFKQVVGADVAIEDISRKHAIDFYEFWLKRVTDKTHSHSSANRDVGNMRTLHGDYFSHVGDKDRPNPFAGLSYAGGIKTTRPPFPIDWLTDKILAPGALDRLNLEARGILIALIDTGCRPSEICNLPPERIILEHNVPHIQIRGRDGREIKSGQSNRDIPLVGVSLQIFRLHPDGFSHRYFDREDSFSCLANKFFKNNGLFPSADHSIYSIRHTFEKRMLEAGIGDELRRRLMGHSLDRPDYGDGGSFEFRQMEMKRFALDIPAGVITGPPGRKKYVPKLRVRRAKRT